MSHLREYKKNITIFIGLRKTRSKMLETAFLPFTSSILEPVWRGAV
jgi:hypothetical protein